NVHWRGNVVVFGAPDSVEEAYPGFGDLPEYVPATTLTLAVSAAGLASLAALGNAGSPASVATALAVIRFAGVPEGTPFHLAISGLAQAFPDRRQLGHFLERVATAHGAPVYLHLDAVGSVVERYVPRPGMAHLDGLPDRVF